VTTVGQLEELNEQYTNLFHFSDKAFAAKS